MLKGTKAAYAALLYKLMMLKKTFFYLVAGLIGAILWFGCNSAPNQQEPNAVPTSPTRPVAVQRWSNTELAQLQSLWLDNLPSPPIDPTNSVSDNRPAALLGHHLFFDVRLSANGQVACASCHIPALSFTDGLAQSFGTRRTQRNAMTLVGVAYSPWFLWDGHKDSLWAQALEPLEHPDEHGTTRLHVVHLIYQDEAYHQMYEAVFGPLPDALADFSRFPDSGGPVEFEPYRQSWETMTVEDQATSTEIFVNVGKAIAAYERLLLPGPSRLDEYIAAILAGDEQAAQPMLTVDEVAGLRLFMGQADCIRCHSGPLFTDFEFHNTGIPIGGAGGEDQGRLLGQALVMADDFNCLSQYSDAEPTACPLTRLEASNPSALYRFKTPTLRNISDTAPYMHRGQFDTLAAVLAHYNEAPPAPRGESELKPLGLSNQQLQQLAAFLNVLTAPFATPEALLEAPNVRVE